MYDVPLPHGGVLRLGARTLVMGVVNVTPDSFAGSGERVDTAKAVADALALIDAGADVLDIGGESTRPGATPVDAGEEEGRVLPVVEALARQSAVPISIDTYKARVARATMACGAALVNDVSGLRYDPDLAGVVAAGRAALVVSHTRGRSRDMYADARYAALADEVTAELEWSLAGAVAAGVPRDQVIVDPGIGFAKRAEHSLAALGHLDRLRALDRPILVGPSRKSYLTAVLGDVTPESREWGTAGAVAACALLGAHIVRVHGVRAMVDVIRVVDAIRAHREAVDPSVKAGPSVPAS